MLLSGEEGQGLRYQSIEQPGPADTQANTPGCTNQACGFRDAFDEIAELGYDVYGLSRDGPTAQKNVSFDVRSAVGEQPADILVESEAETHLQVAV
jgi:hypothetical protein